MPSPTQACDTPCHHSPPDSTDRMPDSHTSPPSPRVPGWDPLRMSPVYMPVTPIPHDGFHDSKPKTPRRPGGRGPQRSAASGVQELSPARPCGRRHRVDTTPWVDSPSGPGFTAAPAW